MPVQKKPIPLAHTLAKFLPEFIPPTAITDPNLVITEGATPTFTYDNFVIGTIDEKEKLVRVKLSGDTNVALSLTDERIWATSAGVFHGTESAVPISGAVVLRIFKFDGSGVLTDEKDANTENFQKQISALRSEALAERKKLEGVLGSYLNIHDLLPLKADLLKNKGSVEVTEKVEELGSSSIEETFNDDVDINLGASSNFRVQGGYLELSASEVVATYLTDSFEGETIGQAPSSWTVDAENSTTVKVVSDGANDADDDDTTDVGPNKAIELAGDNVRKNSKCSVTQTIDLSGAPADTEGRLRFRIKGKKEATNENLTVFARLDSTEEFKVIFTGSTFKKTWDYIDVVIHPDLIGANTEVKFEATLYKANYRIALDNIRVEADLPANGTVVSDEVTFSEIPNNALFIAKTNDIGTLTVSVSRDGGTTFTELTNGDNYTSISSQPSGTSLVYKILMTGAVRVYHIGFLVDAEPT